MKAPSARHPANAFFEVHEVIGIVAALAMLVLRGVVVTRTHGA